MVSCGTSKLRGISFIILLNSYEVISYFFFPSTDTLTVYLKILLMACGNES